MLTLVNACLLGAAWVSESGCLIGKLCSIDRRVHPSIHSSTQPNNSLQSWNHGLCQNGARLRKHGPMPRVHALLSPSLDNCSSQSVYLFCQQIIGSGHCDSVAHKLIKLVHMA